MQTGSLWWSKYLADVLYSSLRMLRQNFCQVKFLRVHSPIIYCLVCECFRTFISFLPLIQLLWNLKNVMIIEQRLLIRFHTAPRELRFRESCALSCFHGHANEMHEYFTHWPLTAIYFHGWLPSSKEKTTQICSAFRDVNSLVSMFYNYSCNLVMYAMHMR